MYDNYHYPPGSDTPDAPWNQPVIPERDFDLTISQSLSRDVSVCTDNYIPEYDEEDGHIYANTDNTEWNKVYEENGCHTPLQLIQLLGEVLQNNLENGIVFKSPRFTRKLIEECDGWTEDETEIFGS